MGLAVWICMYRDIKRVDWSGWGEKMVGVNCFFGCVCVWRMICRAVMYTTHYIYYGRRRLGEKCLNDNMYQKSRPVSTDVKTELARNMAL